jgi:hypothetical protein
VAGGGEKDSQVMTTTKSTSGIYSLLLSETTLLHIMMQRMQRAGHAYKKTWLHGS